MLIVTIDENELHNLGLLLQRIFHGQKIQMVTSVINPRGKYRDGEFSRCEEHLFFVTVGSARVAGELDEDYSEGASIGWRTLRRSDVTSARSTLKGGKSQFYPIYVDNKAGRIIALGEPLPHTAARDTAPKREDCTAVFPIRDDGTEMNWGLTPDSLGALLAEGFVKIGKHEPDKPQPNQVLYLTSGRVEDVRSGRAKVVGHDEAGAAVVKYVVNKIRMPLSTWVRPSHNAETGGTNLVKSLLGEKGFSYPKSLYAVEDAIRFFVKDKPNAVILDFFGGSGTTTHAVVRLNRQDGGKRRSILVTNNEVSEADAMSLIKQGLRPGDPEWEVHGIFEHVTRPRIAAAVTGLTPAGKPIEGHYKFTDEFPMSEGFEENVEFFELIYLDAEDVELDLAFSSIAPLLWMRAGGQGPIIDECMDSAGRRRPYATTDNYGVLFNTDRWSGFVEKLPDTATTVFIVTDSASVFAQLAAELPTGVEAVRLYENYLTTFTINEH